MDFANVYALVCMGSILSAYINFKMALKRGKIKISNTKFNSWAIHVYKAHDNNPKTIIFLRTLLWRKR